MSHYFYFHSTVQDNHVHSLTSLLTLIWRTQLNVLSIWRKFVAKEPSKMFLISLRKKQGIEGLIENLQHILHVEDALESQWLK